MVRAKHLVIDLVKVKGLACEAGVLLCVQHVDLPSHGAVIVKHEGLIDISECIRHSPFHIVTLIITL